MPLQIRSPTSTTHLVSNPRILAGNRADVDLNRSTIISQLLALQTGNGASKLGPRDSERPVNPTDQDRILLKNEVNALPLYINVL